MGHTCRQRVVLKSGLEVPAGLGAQWAPVSDLPCSPSRQRPPRYPEGLRFLSGLEAGGLVGAQGGVGETGMETQEIPNVSC